MDFEEQLVIFNDYFDFLEIIIKKIAKKEKDVIIDTNIYYHYNTYSTDICECCDQELFDDMEDLFLLMIFLKHLSKYARN